MTDNIVKAIQERVGQKEEKKVEKKEVKKVEKKEVEYPKNNSNRIEDLHEAFEKEYKDKEAKIEISLVVDGKELRGKSIVDYIDKNRNKLLKK